MRGSALLVMLALFPSVSLVAAPTAEHGMKVFAERKCSLCHSVAAKGNLKGPLDEVGRTRTGDEIRQWITKPQEMADKAKATRKPPMKGFTDLSKDDLDGLVAYLLTLKSAK